MRITWFLVVLCFLAGNSIHAQGPTEEIEKGDACLAKGDYHYAIVHYSGYLKSDPKNCDVLRSRGLVYLSQLDYPNAIADFSKVIDNKLCKEEMRMDSHVNRGLCYENLEDYKNAKKDFDIGKKWFPNEERILMSSSNVNYYLADFSAAADDYTKLLALPTLSTSRLTIYLYRFDCFYFMDSLDEALKDIESAIALDPNNFNFHGSRFQIHLDMDSLRDAAIDLERIRVLDVTDSVYSGFKGALLFFEGKNAEAVPYLSARIAKFPDNSVASVFYRSKCYYRLKEYRKQIADLDTLIRGTPDSPDLFNKRGWSYLFLKDYTQAMADLNKSISLMDDYIDSYDSRGCAKYLTGDYAGAIKDFNVVLKKDKEYSNSLFYRGLCYLKLGQKAKACADLKRAQKLGDFEVFEGVMGVEEGLKESCK